MSAYDSGLLRSLANPSAFVNNQPRIRARIVRDFCSWSLGLPLDADKANGDFGATSATVLNRDKARNAVYLVLSVYLKGDYIMGTPVVLRV
jgi:hypothetical protein